MKGESRKRKTVSARRTVWGPVAEKTTIIEAPVVAVAAVAAAAAAAAAKEVPIASVAAAAGAAGAAAVRCPFRRGSWSSAGARRWPSKC